MKGFGSILQHAVTSSFRKNPQATIGASDFE
jgi:hypothetical protein